MMSFLIQNERWYDMIGGIGGRSLGISSGKLHSIA